MKAATPIDAYSPRFLVRNVAGLRFFDGWFGPRASLPEHYHDEPSAYVLLRGGLEECFANRSCECAGSTALFKPAGERHSNTISRDGARVLAVSLVGARASVVSPLLPDAIVQVADARLVLLARAMAREMREGDRASELSLEGLALELLGHLARLRSPAAEAISPRWLEHVRDMLGALPPQSAPTLSEIAAAVGRSPRHVARAFRARYGRPLGAFLRETRLAWATTQLVSTDLPLATIALRAGFADQSHFSHAFRRLTGVTPKQYRARFGAAMGPDEPPHR